MFLHSIFFNRENFKTYVRQMAEECVVIGVDSVKIVSVMSIFMGVVMSILLYQNKLRSPLSNDFLVGYGVRALSVLEMAPTVMAIVVAGRVGSSIASQLGSMRISEQIDALEIMGINTTSYLVLPKIIASVLTYPLLVLISMFLTIYSGFMGAKCLMSTSLESYVQGLRFAFEPYTVYVAIYKSLAFAFLISSISSYRGFYVSGGAVEVGKSSTRAVTDSCVAILLADCVLDQLLLSLYD